MTKSEALKILRLSGNPSKEAIKKAYRKMAMRYHPDVNKKADAKTTFIRIHEAFEYLNNPSKFTQPHTTSKPNTNSSPHTRSSAQRQATHRDPYYTRNQNPYDRESFEARYERAQRAAEEAYNTKSQKIYNAIFHKFMQNKLHQNWVKGVAIFSLLLGLLLFIDFISIPINKLTYVEWSNDLASGGNSYFINFDQREIEVSRRFYLSYKNESAAVQYETTPIFKDLRSIFIILKDGNSKVSYDGYFSITDFYPMLFLFLFYPIYGLFYKRPTFKYIWYQIYGTTYVVPALLLFILLYDYRIFRAFGLL